MVDSRLCAAQAVLICSQRTRPIADCTCGAGVARITRVAAVVAPNPHAV